MNYNHNPYLSSYNLMSPTGLRSPYNLPVTSSLVNAPINNLLASQDL